MQAKRKGLAVVLVMGSLIVGYFLAKVIDKKQTIYVPVSEQPILTGQASLNEVDPRTAFTTRRCYVKKEKSERATYEGFSYGNFGYSVDQFSNREKVAYSRLLFASYESRLQEMLNHALRIHLQFPDGDFTGDFSQLKTLDQYFQEHILITHEDIRAYYEQQKANLPANLSFEQIESNLRKTLFENERSRLARKFLAELMDKGLFSPNLREECPPVVDLDLSPFPSIGSSEEDVQWEIAFFAHYSCYACRKTWPQLESIAEKYVDKVKIYPIIYGAGKKGSTEGKLVRAAYCFPPQDNQIRDTFHSHAFRLSRLTMEKKTLDKVLREDIAPKIKGFVMDEINACIVSTDPNAAVLKARAMVEQMELQQNGMTLFINGHMISIDPKKVTSTLEKIINL